MKLPEDLSHVTGLLIGTQWTDLQTGSLKATGHAISYQAGPGMEHLTYYVDASTIQGYRDNTKSRTAAEAAQAESIAQVDAEEKAKAAEEDLGPAHRIRAKHGHSVNTSA